jgi:DNA-binding NarL/FixJ family response regulator
LRHQDILDVIHTVQGESDGTVQVLVLGLAGPPALVLPFIECGASGYVPPDAPVDDLLAAIRAVHDGRPVMTDEVVSALLHRLKELSTFCKDVLANVDSDALTDRERDVLELLAKSRSNAAIADELCIEVGTVKSHVHSILSKLNVNNRKEAGQYYALLGHGVAGDGVVSDGVTSDGTV